MSLRSMVLVFASIVGLAALLGGTPVQASGTWDANGDDKLSREEFCNGSWELWLDQGALHPSDRLEWLSYCSRTSLFASWDRDGDDLLDRFEFARSVFNQWDVAGDGYLCPADWERGAQAWLGDPAHLDVDLYDLDTDRDGYLTRAEFSEGFDWSIF